MPTLKVRDRSRLTFSTKIASMKISMIKILVQRNFLKLKSNLSLILVVRTTHMNNIQVVPHSPFQTMIAQSRFFVQISEN